jgi:hypothetical protein
VPLPAAGHDCETAPEVLDDYFRAARSLADSRPLLIAIDDLPQADPQSVRWWRYIIRRLDGLPVLAMATVDADGPLAADLVTDLDALSYARRLRPEPLCERCSATFLANHLDRPVGDELAAVCYAMSQGNPLVLRRLAEALDAAGVEPDDTGRHELERLGARVLAETTLSWLRHSRPAVATLLENLAVLGPDGDLETAAMIAGRGESAAREARTVLRERGILAPAAPGRLDGAGPEGSPDVAARTAERFTHEAVRGAVLFPIDAATRADLHARAAKLLFRLGQPASVVAEHLMSIGPVDDRWTAAVLRARGLEDPELPEVAGTGAVPGPPPTHRWAERDPAAAARLAAAREAVATLAAARRLPVENLLPPDALRRLAWEPPTPATGEAVAGVLRGYGARPWQAGLTADLLATAFAAASGALARPRRLRSATTRRFASRRAETYRGWTARCLPPLPPS